MRGTEANAAVKRMKQSKAKKAPSGKYPKSIPIFYLLAGLQRVGREAEDYAHMCSSIQAWIKATGKDAATESIKRRLSAEEWRLRKPLLLSRVDAGFARLGSLMEPPVFSDEEADEWTQQYRIAEVEGFSCLISHSDKAVH